MSGAAKVKPGTSKKLRSVKKNERAREQGDGPKDLIQDQVIIAPEIMRLILGKLDLRSLKQVRLSCKSWLWEAQIHMERRGIVILHREFSPSRIQDFKICCQNKIVNLPKPFKSIDVNPRSKKMDRLPQKKRLISQLSSLCSTPMFVITRLAPSGIPLDVTLPLILQCAPSLEFLRLNIETCKPGYLPLMDPEQEFPKLRHIELDALSPRVRANKKVHFATIVAWIIGGCPNLEAYHSSSILSEDCIETVSELLLESDIKNVKTLSLSEYLLNRAAFDHLLSIPFARLQNLRMTFVFASNGQDAEISQALTVTASKAAATLRILDLSLSELIEEDLAQINFPICPNVQELTLSTFSCSTNFVSIHFPSLRILRTRIFKINLEKGWEDFSPLYSLKTLRFEDVRIIYNSDSIIDVKETLKVLDKFPALERLRGKLSFVVLCCRVKSSGDPQVSNIVGGIKHLELVGSRNASLGRPSVTQDDGEDSDDSSTDEFNDYPWLATLKNLETITFMEFNQAVTALPVKDLPLLKLIQFPWCQASDSLTAGLLHQLLEMARGVEKVLVTNCCSIPRIGDQQSKNLLKQFFDSARNARCGCEEWNKSKPF